MGKSMRNLDSVLVVGGGIGGLGVAVALSNRGIKVSVVEKRANNAVLGVGINQPGNSLKALKKLGVLDRVRTGGFEFDLMTFYDRFGNFIVDIPSTLGTDEIPANCALSRTELANSLYDEAIGAGAIIHHNIEVMELDDDGESVGIVGEGDILGRFDLAVVFDGTNSNIRPQLFGDKFDPKFTGYFVWRVTLPRPESLRSLKVFHGEKSVVGLIPLSVTSMYMFVTHREEEGVRYDPADFHKVLIGYLGEFRGMVGELRDSISEDADIVCTVQNELLVEPRWHKGRIVIAGDAAHVAAPTMTQGAAMALEDAVVLAEMLDSDRPLDDILTEFAEKRIPRIRLVANTSGDILRWDTPVEMLGYEGALEKLNHANERLKEVEKILNQFV